MTLISHCRYEVMAIIHCIYTHCRLRIQSSIRIKLYMISCTKLHLDSLVSQPRQAHSGIEWLLHKEHPCQLLSQTSYTGVSSHIWNTTNLLNKTQKLPSLSTVHHIEMDLHVKPTDTHVNASKSSAAVQGHSKTAIPYCQVQENLLT